jgi:signal transduction histidine kinase
MFVLMRFLDKAMDFLGHSFPFTGFLCSADGSLLRIWLPLQMKLPIDYSFLADLCRDPHLLTPSDAPSSGLLHLLTQEGGLLPKRYTRYILENDMLLFVLEEAEQRSLKLLCDNLAHSAFSCTNGIHSYELALLEDYGEILDETGLRYISKISGQSKKVRSLIDALRIYSHIALVDHVDNVCEIEPRTLILEIVGRLQFPISTEVTIDKLPNIVSYKKPLASILTELLKNARSFSDEQNGFVSVTYSETIYSVCLHFSNNGPGFIGDTALSAFEPFRKFLDTGDNIGMGLTIAQRTANSIGGRLLLRTSDGMTTFTLELPKWKPCQ